MTEEQMTLKQAKIKVQEMILAKLKSMPHAYDHEVHDAVFDDIKAMPEQAGGERATFALALANLTGDAFYCHII